MCFFKMIDINGFIVGKLSLGIDNYQLFFYYANICIKDKNISFSPASFLILKNYFQFLFLYLEGIIGKQPLLK